MKEKDLVLRVIDFAFIIKAQLHSDDTAVLRSILNILIMEAEDVIGDLESGEKNPSENNSGQSWA